MANALIPLGKITLTSAQSNIVLAGIPQGFRDIRIVATVKMTNNYVQTAFTVNNDTGANYSRVGAVAWGASNVGNFGSSGLNQVYLMNYSAPPNTDTVAITVDFLGYSKTDRHKIGLFKSGHSTEVDLVAARWASTSAITSVTLTPDTATYAAGTTVELFGVLA